LPYIGIKVMGQDPSSFHALPWDVYSPTDASNDAATDSTRWRMTARSGFDTPVTGDVDGSFLNLNLGKVIIDAWSSQVFTVAYMYSTSLAGLQSVATAAEARFNGATSVHQVNTTVPGNYALKQNYPNPFNPSSTIEFQIAKETQVSLKVYNMLGQEVATLVNEKLAAGHYTSRFDGNRLASGVYFYRLAAGSFTQTRQMLLLK